MIWGHYLLKLDRCLSNVSHRKTQLLVQRRQNSRMFSTYTHSPHNHHHHLRGSPRYKTHILSIENTQSSHIKTFRLFKPDDFNYLAGQAIDIFIPNPIKNQTEVSSFSLISSPNSLDKGSIEIAVKETGYYPIQWLLHQSKVGDEFSMSSAMGSLQFPPPASRGLDPLAPLLLIGGGIGITPILSVSGYLSSLEIDRRPKKVVIIQQANSSKEFIHWERLYELAKKDDRVSLRYLISDRANAASEIPTLEPELAGLTSVGTVTAEMLAQFRLSNDTSSILCGPKGMVESIKNTLATSFGITSKQII